MTGEIILGLALGLPLVLGLLFRVSTSHIFFSLMAGELLGRYFGHDVEAQAAHMNQTDITGYGEAMLIILPMILTAFFLRGSISKGKALLHIIPLVVTGIVCAAFVLPVLPTELQAEVSAFAPGARLLELNRAIIGGMVALQLVSLWILNRGESKHKKPKHH